MKFHPSAPQVRKGGRTNLGRREGLRFQSFAVPFHGAVLVRGGGGLAGLEGGEEAPPLLLVRRHDALSLAQVALRCSKSLKIIHFLKDFSTAPTEARQAQVTKSNQNTTRTSFVKRVVRPPAARKFLVWRSCDI